ncbi:MAG: hypothetical protein H7A32_03130 [Deltaproteobacteria bacterium]|nr:hypothetical protein [Deltaproteobacteria bacterium]
MTSIFRDKAKEICGIFVDEKIPVIEASNQISVIESRSSDRFQKCVDMLTIKMHQHQRTGNSLLTGMQFRNFNQHIKQQGYSLEIISPLLQGPYASVNIAVMGKKVLFNPSWPGFVLDENAIFIGDHEIQHGVDIKELQQAFPKIGNLFDNSSLTKDEMITKLNAYLEYFSQGLKCEQAEEFNALKEQIFGDFNLWDESDLVLAGLIFYETMRYAYENNDNRLKQYVFSKDFLPFKKNNKMGEFTITNHMGKKVDLKNAAIKARLIEADLWDEFSQFENFDRETAEKVDEDLVLFFRLAIIGITQRRL